MICLAKVMIGNKLDDTLRCEIIAYDSNDNFVLDNFESVIQNQIDLSEYSMEYISQIFKKIKPIVIATDEEVFYDVSKTFR